MNSAIVRSPSARYIVFVVLSASFFFFGSMSPVRADLKDDINAQRNLAGVRSGAAGETEPRVIVAKIVNATLGLLGAIFFGLMVYAGYLWMTAGGESDPVDKAKETMRRAVIGLIIVLAAYAISKFITVALQKGTSG